MTFVETKLFTRQVREYLTDDGYHDLQKALVTIRKPVTSSGAPAGSGSCGGESPVEASAVAFA